MSYYYSSGAICQLLIERASGFSYPSSPASLGSSSPPSSPYPSFLFKAYNLASICSSICNSNPPSWQIYPTKSLNKFTIFSEEDRYSLRAPSWVFLTKHWVNNTTSPINPPNSPTEGASAEWLSISAITWESKLGLYSPLLTSCSKAYYFNLSLLSFSNFFLFSSFLSAILLYLSSSSSLLLSSSSSLLFFSLSRASWCTFLLSSRP